MIEVDPEESDDAEKLSADPLRRTRVKATIAKRQQHFRQYERWCDARGLDAKAASASAMAAYIEDFASHVSYTTQRNRIDSLRMTYASRGVPWPSNDSPIRWALESVRHKMGARASTPLTDAELDDLARLMARSEQERDLHDWALISVASELGLETSEVVRLRVEHVEFDGVDSVAVVGFRTSGTRAITAYAHSDMFRCAVLALHRWIDTRDAEMPTLFYRRDPDASPRVLQRRDVNGIVMRRMKAIGRTAQRYSAQSMTAYGQFGRDSRRLWPRRGAKDR